MEPHQMTANPATPTGDVPAVKLKALTPRERNRLRLLAQRYHARRDAALRPIADVLFDQRHRRQETRLSTGQVISRPIRRAGQ
jgi:hypothetical protein